VVAVKVATAITAALKMSSIVLSFQRL
jgi:hypothetical protein